jgi:hypothetical protein
MSDRNDSKQPLDHLAPQEERGDAAQTEEPHYPGSGGPAGDSPVSPETAAEPDKPDRHGVDKLPPTGR